MARGRMISKAISLDEKVNALSDDTARLLFTWIIPHLDCEGRLHGDATTIKSIIFPRRNISVGKIETYLKEMEKLKLILRFSVNGNTYLFAPHFEKHQIGLQKSKEAQSLIPTPTPELIQSKVGVGHLQVEVETKVEIKDEVQTKDNSNSKEKPRMTSDDIAEIATLYQGEIGQITKYVGEALNDAVQQYPAQDIKDAIKEAVIRNKRNWKYIVAILENWKKDGRGGKGAKGDPDKYIKGKYGHMVQR